MQRGQLIAILRSSQPALAFCRPSRSQPAAQSTSTLHVQPGRRRQHRHSPSRLDKSVSWTNRAPFPPFSRPILFCPMQGIPPPPPHPGTRIAHEIARAPLTLGANPGSQGSIDACNTESGAAALPWVVLCGEDSPEPALCSCSGREPGQGDRTQSVQGPPWTAILPMPSKSNRAASSAIGPRHKYGWPSALRAQSGAIGVGETPRFGLQFRRRRDPSACLSCCRRFPAKASSPLPIRQNLGGLSRRVKNSDSTATCSARPPARYIAHHRVLELTAVADMRLFTTPRRPRPPLPQDWPHPSRPRNRRALVRKGNQRSPQGIRPMMPSPVCFSLLPSCATVLVHAYVRSGARPTVGFFLRFPAGLSNEDRSVAGMGLARRRPLSFCPVRLPIRGRGLSVPVAPSWRPQGRSCSWSEGSAAAGVKWRAWRVPCHKVHVGARGAKISMRARLSLAPNARYRHRTLAARLL